MTKTHIPVSVVKSDGGHMKGIDLIGQGYILDSFQNHILEHLLYNFFIEDGKAIIYQEIGDIADTPNSDISEATDPKKTIEKKKTSKKKGNGK